MPPCAPAKLPRGRLRPEAWPGQKTDLRLLAGERGAARPTGLEVKGETILHRAKDVVLVLKWRHGSAAALSRAGVRAHEILEIWVCFLLEHYRGNGLISQPYFFPAYYSPSRPIPIICPFPFPPNVVRCSFSSRPIPTPRILPLLPPISVKGCRFGRQKTRPEEMGGIF